MAFTLCSEEPPWDFVNMFPGVPGTVWGGSRIANPHFNQSSAKMICFVCLLPYKQTFTQSKKRKGFIL